MKIQNLLFLIFLLVGCSDTKHKNEVVVYTSVDQHYSEPVLAAFEADTGIHVRTAFDVEASKTTGLVNRLIAEQKKPKADVFWNGEFVQTALLASHGILTKYKPSTTNETLWSDPENYWSAFGGRARVLVINRDKLVDSPFPRTLDDFLDQRWPPEKIGLALPLFGTTATHAAALWAHMGKNKASDFFKQLKERGVSFFDGNSVVRDKVASGELWFGLTDSDDACAAVARGAPIEICFLDQDPKEMGTLVIPNTVALIAGGPNLENGRRLIDYLLMEKTKEHLARLGWFHILNGRVGTELDCPLPATIHIQDISPHKIVNNFGQSQSYLRKLLLR